MEVHMHDIVGFSYNGMIVYGVIIARFGDCPIVKSELWGNEPITTYIVPLKRITSVNWIGVPIGTIVQFIAP